MQQSRIFPPKDSFKRLLLNSPKFCFEIKARLFFGSLIGELEEIVDFLNIFSISVHLSAIVLDSLDWCKGFGTLIIRLDNWTFGIENKTHLDSEYLSLSGLPNELEIEFHCALIVSRLSEKDLLSKGGGNSFGKYPNLSNSFSIILVGFQIVHNGLV